MMRSLDEIRGVGAGVKARLLAYYSSEELALKSLERLEFEGLVQAGVPARKCEEIARWLVTQRYGFSYAEIARTREARELYARLQRTLKGYAKTAYARVALSTYHTTLDRGELQRRFAFSERCARLAERLEGRRAEVEELLEKIKPLQEGAPRIEGVIAVEDERMYEELARRLGGKSSLLLIEEISDLEHLRDFELVRYVAQSSRFLDQALGLENVEPVYEEEPELVLPELILSYYSANCESVLAAIRLVEELSDVEDGAGALAEEAEALKSILETTVLKGVDEEAERLGSALARLDEAVAECRDWVNRRLEEKIGSMRLEGRELLRLLSLRSEGGLLESLPRDFEAVIREAVREGEEKAADAIGVESGALRGVLTATSLPVGVDEERLAEVRRWLVGEERRALLRAGREGARRLMPYCKLVERLLRWAMELDLMLAIGFYCLDHGLTRPRLLEKPGIAFKGGRNVFLEQPQPIDYALGSSSIHPKHSERAVVITGANSGGKTTLLELIAQTALLIQMGLGAPAGEAESSLFEEIYYFGGVRGRDAGAFETLLTTFESLSRTTGRRLILADEIEAITEPGAAAKIIAGLLAWYSRDENTLIALVSHLGDHLSEQIGVGVRIDGIEARGLDEDLNLIVDRQPLFGRLAKSTPELILEKLSRSSEEKEFYAKLLERFRRWG